MTAEKPRSLHDRLLAQFRADIVGQIWPPGFQLPFETDLATAHNVSRMTMNKVLSQLTREGYLVRRRKLGTFVAQPRAQSAVMQINDIAAEVQALGLSYRFALIGQSLRPPLPQERQQAQIAAEETEAVLALQGLHYAGDAPFCLEDRIISLLAAPAAAAQDFSVTSPGEWLRKEIPWTSAEHLIRAVNASGAVARSLGLALGEACLEITRRTEIAGQWVTLVTQTYPGERHQLVSRFTPSGGPPQA